MTRINICYTRCSSTEQDTEHQIKSINDYAAKNSIAIDKYISDEGLSGFKLDVEQRPGIQEVLHLVQQDKVANLLIFESSRISRRMVQYQTVMDIFTQHNVKVHSVSENTILNAHDIDKLLNAFKGWMAEQSSIETGKRVKSAHELLRQQGKWAAGSIPYGYRLIDGYAVIDEDLAPQIITMFEDYINYDSKYVQDKYGIKNRKTLIDRISHPMIKDIVGDDLFVRANRVRTSRRCTSKSSANSLNRTDVLFEGLLYHKCCGSKLYLNRDYRSKGKPHNYRCKACRGDNSISNKKSFSGTKLDTHIEEQILDILDSLDHDALVEKYASRCTKKQAIIELKVHELTTTHSTKQRALELGKARLTESILNNAPSATIDAISNMIASVSEELVDIEEQLNIQQESLNQIKEQTSYQEALIADILNACDIYKNAGIQQKKAILQMLVNRIEVTDVDSVDIYLNI
jgi:DNA invertase Pin-like site-specific DNA recombinase